MFQNVRNWFSANSRIERTLEYVKMKAAEASAALDEIKGVVTNIANTVTKVKNETATTLQKVNDLEAVIAQQNDGDIPQEIADKIAELRTSATNADAGIKEVDELIPDEISSGETTPPT